MFSPVNGILVSAGERGRYGKVVEVKSRDGITTKFAHLGEFRVREGQKVQRGDLIARVGMSGAAQKPHVHIETFVNGERRDPTRVWQLSYKPWLQL